MKITFVTPTPPDVAAFGVRSLSAYLKRAGYQVRNLFLPGGVKKYKYQKGYKYGYEKNILDKIIELCKESDLIGISFMTNYYDRALQLTETIKSCLGIPVLWGGIHPTVTPEQSLQHCDMVCLGEGEEAILELLEKMKYGHNIFDTRNIWFNKNGDIIKNSLRPLIQDLDSLPFYDFGMEDHFIFDHLKKEIAPMSKELLKKCFPLEPNVEGSFNDSYKRSISYKTMGSRGCPHRCTYCAERTLALLYPGERYFRRRSVSHIIDELTDVKKNLPFIESIFLFDDAFTARSLTEIKEFSKAYRDAISLPFHIQVSPLTITKDKMEALIDGGLAFAEMGIQSVSNRGMDVYKRKVSKETILEKASIINKFVGKIHVPCYHLILDNPWEQIEDNIETLNLVLQFPPPFWLKRSSLVCFPGTELYNRAKEDGIIETSDDEQREIYNKHLHMPKATYMNFLFYLTGFSYFPRSIIKFFTKKQMLNFFGQTCFSKVFRLAYRMIEFSIFFSKGVRAFFTGDFHRIYRFVKHWYP